MNTPTEKTFKTPSGDGMTLKEFKKEIRVYARTCIPDEVRYLIQVDEDESNYLYLSSTKEEGVLDLIKEKFGKDSISTQILEPFGYRDSENLRFLELFPDVNEADFLEEEKERVKNKIAEVLKSGKSQVHQLIQTASNELFEKAGLKTVSIQSLEKLKVNENGEERSFYVVGHHYWTNSKLEEFIEENRWENGSKDKFFEVVKSVNVGDVIFDKIVPFKKQQYHLNIYAVGVVLSNRNDGQNLNVKWKHLDQLVDFVVTADYRHAIHKIEPEFLDDILMGILEVEDDLSGIIQKLSSDNTYNHSQIESLISFNLSSGANFWWLNGGDKWTIDNLVVGDQESYGTAGATGEYLDHVKSLKKHDFLIGYEAKPDSNIVGIFAITEEFNDEEHYYFELLYKFKKRTTIDELKELRFFSRSPLSQSLQGSLHQIEADLFKEIISSTEFELPDVIQKPNYELKSASIDNDGASTSIDLLEIENDVRSFALLLASKDIKPPLAIALFGKWGAGKSFFMKHLIKRVGELSVNQGFLINADDTKPDNLEAKEEPFCKGIAQIEFNAWSYLDANLWAGLVSSIFEKLNEYIGDTTKSGVAKLKVKNRLKERLKSLQQSKQTQEEKRNELEAQKSEFEKEKKNVEEQIKCNFVNEILSLTNSKDGIKDLYESMDEDLSKLASHLQLEELQEEIKIWRNFWLNIKKSEGLRKYLLVGLASVLLIIPIYYFVLPILSWSVAALPLITFGLDIKKLSKRYQQVKAYVTKFNKCVSQNNELKNKVDSYKKRTKELINDIDFAEKEIQKIDDQISSTIVKVDYGLSEETFREVLEKRANHEDYSKHLGIISVIRRDLELLSELFYEMNDEETSATDNHDGLDQLKEDRAYLKDQFLPGKKLDRIVLYIDDLDRCSDEKVLDVIQAVHLLMAFPLFNVVVGVDKRCVKNALLLKTKLEYRKIAPLDEIEKLGIDLILPEEYLEKIFQIPFELKDPNNTDIQRLVGHLLKDQILVIESESEEPESEGSEEPMVEDPIVEEPEQEYKTNLITKLLEEHARTQELGNNKPLVSSAPQSLRLLESEFQQVKEITFLVGSTPRTIKRFINIYRIIRAYKRPETTDELTTEDHLAIMLLLAIGVGDYKDVADKLNKLVISSPDQQVSEYFKQIKELSVLEQTIIRNETIKGLLDFKGELLLKHIPFVSRFSFGKGEQSEVGSEGIEVNGMKR